MCQINAKSTITEKTGTITQRERGRERKAGWMACQSSQQLSNRERDRWNAGNKIKPRYDNHVPIELILWQPLVRRHYLPADVVVSAFYIVDFALAHFPGHLMGHVGKTTRSHFVGPVISQPVGRQIVLIRLRTAEEKTMLNVKNKMQLAI